MKNTVETVKKALSKKKPAVKKVVHTAPGTLYYVLGLNDFDAEVYEDYSPLVDGDVVGVYKLVGFQKITHQTVVSAVNEFGEELAVGTQEDNKVA